MRHLARASFAPGGPFVARKAFWLNGDKVAPGDPIDVSKIPNHRQATLYRTGLIGMATPEPTPEVPGVERSEISITSPPFPAPKPKKRSRSKPKG